MTNTSSTSVPVHSATSHYLTEQDAADYTRFAAKTLRNMRTLGTGPAFLRIGRSIRYQKPEIDRWLTSGSGTGRAA